jgi:membrane-associated phospholipid phosphatase
VRIVRWHLTVPTTVVFLKTGVSPKPIKTGGTAGGGPGPPAARPPQQGTGNADLLRPRLGARAGAGGDALARFGGLRPRAWRASRTACFFAHPGRTLLEAGGLLVLFTLVAQFVPAHPMALDTRWSTWMRDIQTPALKQVALIFNSLGMGYWRVVPLVAVGLLLVLARRWGALTAFALSAALTLFGSDLIKTWVDRPRPPRHIVPAKGASFPSSHAAYAAMLAVTLILVCTKPSRRRLLWLVPVALVIACMAWSRTYLQVHWLTDAAAGSLLAIGITVGSFSGVQLLFGRQP